MAVHPYVYRFPNTCLYILMFISTLTHVCTSLCLYLPKYMPVHVHPCAYIHPNTWLYIHVFLTPVHILKYTFNMWQYLCIAVNVSLNMHMYMYVYYMHISAFIGGHVCTLPDIHRQTSSSPFRCPWTSSVHRKWASMQAKAKAKHGAAVNYFMVFLIRHECWCW